MSEATRICVIGAGSFANYAHGPSLRFLADRDPNLQLAGVADLEAGRAADFAGRFGFDRSYGDWRRMLHELRPTGTVVLTQVAATAETASRVIADGCPVMMEKPPGRTREEICHIIRAVKTTGTPAITAFNRRYSPLLNQMLAIHRNECGEPAEHVRCDFYRYNRHDPDFSTTAIHGIDALRFISGGAYRSAALFYQGLDREKPAANIFLDAEFSNDVSGFISFCPTTGANFERYVLNTRHWTLIAETVVPGNGADWPGRIFVYHDGSLLRIESPAPHPLSEEPVYLAGYYSEHEAFIRYLRAGFPADDDLEMSLDAVEIADALRRRLPRWRKES